MKKFFEEFKQFAMRGNVIDLAVGVVVGGAFGKITNSLVNDIIMPAVSMLTELIFLIRTGASKEELLSRIQSEYEIPHIEEIRPTYRFDMSCKGTLPVCFAAFYESKDFEDALRLSVSLGGDTDTNGAITCSLAEAFYGVPDALWNNALPYCDDAILSMVSDFYNSL